MKSVKSSLDFAIDRFFFIKLFQTNAINVVRLCIGGTTPKFLGAKSAAHDRYSTSSAFYVQPFGRCGKVPNLQKVGNLIHSRTRDLIFIFFVTALVIYMRTKFEVSSFTVPEIWRRSQNFSSRSLDLFPILIDLILYFFSLLPLMDYMQATFEVSSFTRSRAMERVPKFQK